MLLESSRNASPRHQWGGSLRDDSNNCCEGDYSVTELLSSATLFLPPIQQDSGHSRYGRSLFPQLSSLIVTFFTHFAPTSFPGSLIFLKRDPGLGWSCVFQILADSTDVIEGRGWKVKVCLTLSLPIEPSREWNLQRSRKNHSEGIDTFDVGVQSIHCSAKRLPLH